MTYGEAQQPNSGLSGLSIVIRGTRNPPRRLGSAVPLQAILLVPELRRLDKRPRLGSRQEPEFNVRYQKMKFTAIDFETANSSRSSACAVGLSLVEDGKIVARVHQLIRPNPLYFDPVNVSIHGITEADVADAPSFAELWPHLVQKVQGPLVAHNASFDMSVLRHVLDESGIPYPAADYFCTCVIAKLTWPEHPTYRLNDLARALDIRFRHHDAAEDARACALIALSACKIHRVRSLYDLQDVCGLRVGSLYVGGYVTCGGPRKRRARRA